MSEAVGIPVKILTGHFPNGSRRLSGRGRKRRAHTHIFLENINVGQDINPRVDSGVVKGRDLARRTS